MYLRTKQELSVSLLSKVVACQTDRQTYKQTDGTKDVTTPHSKISKGAKNRG